MIVGEHRHHAHVRRPLHRPEILKHEAGQFEDHEMGLVDLMQLVEQWPPNVAADPGCESGSEHLAEQGGGGGFPLASGDAQDRCRAAFDEQPDFGGDRDAGFHRGAQVFVSGGIAGDADDQIDAAEIFDPVSAKTKLDGQPRKLLDRICELLRLRLIRDEDLRALVRASAPRRSARRSGPGPRRSRACLPGLAWRWKVDACDARLAANRRASASSSRDALRCGAATLSARSLRVALTFTFRAETLSQTIATVSAH